MHDLTRQVARSGRAFVSHPPPQPRPRDPGDPPLPSIARQATGFARSAVAVVASGLTRVSPEDQAARLAVCEACDHYRASDGRCGMETGCGCYVRLKSAFAAATCPVNRWPAPTCSPDRPDCTATGNHPGTGSIP